MCRRKGKEKLGKVFFLPSLNTRHCGWLDAKIKTFPSVRTSPRAFLSLSLSFLSPPRVESRHTLTKIHDTKERNLNSIAEKGKCARVAAKRSRKITERRRRRARAYGDLKNYVTAF